MFVDGGEDFCANVEQQHQSLNIERAHALTGVQLHAERRQRQAQLAEALASLRSARARGDASDELEAKSDAEIQAYALQCLTVEARRRGEHG